MLSWERVSPYRFALANESGCCLIYSYPSSPDGSTSLLYTVWGAKTAPFAMTTTSARGNKTNSSSSLKDNNSNDSNWTDAEDDDDVESDIDSIRKKFQKFYIAKFSPSIARLDGTSLLITCEKKQFIHVLDLNRKIYQTLDLASECPQEFWTNSSPENINIAAAQKFQIQKLPNQNSQFQKINLKICGLAFTHDGTAAYVGVNGHTSIARAVDNYTAVNVNELTFTEGTIINIISKSDSDWWEGEINGQRGIFPSTSVELINQATKGNIIKLELAGVPPLKEMCVAYIQKNLDKWPPVSVHRHLPQTLVAEIFQPLGLGPKNN
jgi:hypothetical protein